MGIALVRSVASSFARALSSTGARIDVARTREQHEAYVRALHSSLGLEIVGIDADEACPDCVFIEVTVVCADGVALVTRPGAPSRAAETGPVRVALVGLGMRVVDMEAPATLDGGDCLRLGRDLFVGRSDRTNEAGIAGLRSVFEPLGYAVREVPVEGALHLKSACSGLGDGRVLLVEGLLDASAFAGHEVEWIPRSEMRAANCLAVSGKALVAAGCRVTVERLAATGVVVIPIDVSEMAKADGALTCMSILL